MNEERLRALNLPSLMFGRSMKKKPSGTGSVKKTPQDIFYESLVSMVEAIYKNEDNYIQL